MVADLYLGLVSGTSVDGIDAALVRFDPLQVLTARTFALPAALRARVLDWSQANRALDPDALARLDVALGRAFADAANALIAESGVARSAIVAIGLHGQTLRHDPSGDYPFTLQLADPNQLSERCMLTTVADFRRRDVAAGGQGAPLMPAFHAAVFADPDEARAVLNLGGIANLTLLIPGKPVLGFDTGPANGLMDAWCQRHRGEPFDRDGAFAGSGRVDADLLAALAADPYFALSAPKSTGRDYFDLDWLDWHLAGRVVVPTDVQASLCALTVVTVADALRRYAPQVRRLLVCGGGVHNPVLLSALGERLPQVTVQSTAAFGLDPDFVEAVGFAWLARETLAGRPGNRPEVTGACGPRVLGAIWSA